MTDTLQWADRAQTRFSDGSHIADWELIHQSDQWHWQYDTHELTFAIYRHDGQFWKLYQARFVEPGDDRYSYGYGGQACRMVEVEYLRRCRSPHSKMLKESGAQEWIRTYEFDPSAQRVLRAGERDGRYGGPRMAAANG